MDFVKHQVVQKLSVINYAVCVKQTSKSKAINDTSLQGTYKLSHSWVTVWTTVQMNNTKCSQKDFALGIMSQHKLWPFQYSPHMLGSTNINEPPILWWSKFLEGRLTIFEEDPVSHPHTCLVQWPYEKLSLSRLPGAARSTLLKQSNSLSMSLSNIATARYLVLNTPDKKETHTSQQRNVFQAGKYRT